MPQMSPMYWLLLLFYFLFIMVFLMTFIYFNYFNVAKMSNVNLGVHEINWMW
uniref:ATP synthase F0 subunit 8 n=1 Tax=Mendozana platypleura TaxID=2219948 RepID=A0A3S5GLC0_9HEMI|nr:ATP synthase F0 subunit 8 [Mendozana platypleura]